MARFEMAADCTRPAAAPASGQTKRPSVEAHDTSDEALIAKIASGNRLAMQALFVRHHTRVYRFILRLVGDAATADDVTSEVFLAVWQEARRFEARSAASTWLLAIARFKALAELRRRREPASDVEDTAASDPAADPEAAFAIKHRGEILRKCLTRLSREHREIIDLVYYHERSVQEVAAIVGIPCNTVKTRMFYARRKLSELLAAQGVVGASS
jgi:RNA polymerase sigma-70 factor (ECF subfamily)